MSVVYFISDLHLGHKNILQFSGGLRDGNTVEEHDHIILERIKLTVNKRDVLYICGDIILTHDKEQEKKYLREIADIPGAKYLIRGNHDNLNIIDYSSVFQDIYGIHKYKKYWLTHAPIHPSELRGKGNIHGHCHLERIKNQYNEIDPRYINVCVEMNRGWPISYSDILASKTTLGMRDL